ncbi:MAG: trypsin-like peptidase domain-containing protein [Simkaniaceae bacterium]|jgi:S1-C subfamily serine protease|nr:MAG: trypsin-like peptidase domain-containing protein [Simkaniaceae bacterium]
MKYFFWLLFLPFSLFASHAINDAVVKVFATVKEYDYSRPWASPATFRATGSGFVIRGNQIITNAHVVANAAFIEVHTGRNRKKFEAKVKMIGHDCDLALLEVEDPSFFEGKIPLYFSEEILPREEPVQVYGFPIGGNELSITRGIVSRVELWKYAHSGENLLISQIDAPINPGNSGGPVIANGKVVGIAHQGHKTGQNIGYMIPIPIILHFLDENPQKYLGFPCSSFSYQQMENEGLRSYYGLEKEDGGLLITAIPENHFFHSLLQRGDILLEVDHFPIDSMGSVFFEEIDIKLPFQMTILMKNFGDPISLTVLREGERLEIHGTVDHSKKGKPLVPYDLFEKKPTYYIYGGCIFQPLIGNLIRDCLPRIDFLHYALRGKVNEERNEVVVLTSILDDHVNAGYQDLESKVIDRVNGKKFMNLRDFISMIEESQAPFIVMTTIDDIEIILNRELVQEREKEILRHYFIPSDRSEDLR